MKKVVFATLIASAFPVSYAHAEPATCTQYYKEMQAVLKKGGGDTAAAMKVIKDQVAALPAARQAEFCKSAIQGMKDAEKDSAKGDEDDD